MSCPLQLPPLSDSITVAIDLIANLDQCLFIGFANLDSTQRDGLESLQRIFAGTPLSDRLNDSLAAIDRNEFLDRHFAVFASARLALQGALFDNLQAQLRQSLQRPELPALDLTNGEVPELPPGVTVWLESVRHWLMELALAGFARLDASRLTPFMTTLEQLQTVPALMGEAALLTGWFNELMAAVPIRDSHQVPLYRWGDLWSQAMVGALQPPSILAATSVSGSLELLGLDLRQHANVVSFVAYGLLTTNEQTHWVRITQSAYKVDAIADKQAWLLFAQSHLLLDALSQCKALLVQDCSLLPTGDLLWNQQGSLGSKYDLMAKAATVFSLDSTNPIAPCLLPPLHRHPIQLAEPIFLQGYQVHSQAERLHLDWGNGEMIPIAMERLTALSEITPEAIAASTQLFGLLRFNAGQWAVHPLAVSSGGSKAKVIYTGQNAAQMLKKPPKASTVALLQERASRLLRQKS